MSLPVTECNESSLQFQYTNLWCGVSGQQHSCSIVEWSVVSWVITLKKLVLLLTTLGQPLSPEVHSVSTGMGAMSYHWQQLRRLVIQFYYCWLEVYLGGCRNNKLGICPTLLPQSAFPLAYWGLSLTCQPSTLPKNAKTFPCNSLTSIFSLHKKADVVLKGTSINEHNK